MEVGRPNTIHDFGKEAWAVTESILEYFDNYRLGSAAPIATEIEFAMKRAYEQGKKDAR